MGDALRQSLLVVVQRRDLFLVLLVLGVEVGESGVNLLDEHLGLGLVVLGADSLELQLELQFDSFVLERCPGFLDPCFNGLENPVQLPEALQLLPGRFAGAVLEVIDQGLEDLLEDGRADLLAFVGLIGSDFLGGFHGLGPTRPGLRRYWLRVSRWRPPLPERRLGSDSRWGRGCGASRWRRSF